MGPPLGTGTPGFCQVPASPTSPAHVPATGGIANPFQVCASPCSKSSRGFLNIQHHPASAGCATELLTSKDPQLGRWKRSRDGEQRSPPRGWLAWFPGRELAKLPVCRLHFQEQKWERRRTPQSICMGQTGVSPGRAGLGADGSTLSPSPRTDTVAGLPRGPRVVQPYERSCCLQITPRFPPWQAASPRPLPGLAIWHFPPAPTARLGSGVKNTRTACALTTKPPTGALSAATPWLCLPRGGCRNAGSHPCCIPG